MVPGISRYTTTTNGWFDTCGTAVQDIVYINGHRYVRDEYSSTITIHNDPNEISSSQNRKEQRANLANLNSSRRIPRRGNKRFKRASKHK
jgi:hypothetical protein